MTRRAPYLLLLGISLLTVTSCEIINPDEPIPAYIHIPDVNFTANVATEGSASERIVDVWVFVDAKSIGVYPIPVSIPILQTGTPKITISAGILENGISHTRKLYPFYASQFVNDGTLTIELEPGKVDTIIPQFTYLPQVNFAVMENFDGIGIDMERISGSANLLKISASDGGFEGNSGLIHLTQTDSMYTGVTTEKMPVPHQGTDVYIELNYRCNTTLQIGLQGTFASGAEAQYFKLVINPREEWNKIYVNVTKDVVDMKAKEYQVMLRTELPDSMTTADVFIDNIKMITF